MFVVTNRSKLYEIHNNALNPKKLSTSQLLDQRILLSAINCVYSAELDEIVLEEKEYQLFESLQESTGDFLNKSNKDSKHKQLGCTLFIDGNRYYLDSYLKINRYLREQIHEHGLNPHAKVAIYWHLFKDLFEGKLSDFLDNWEIPIAIKTCKFCGADERHFHQWDGTTPTEDGLVNHVECQKCDQYLGYTL